MSIESISTSNYNTTANKTNKTDNKTNTSKAESSSTASSSQTSSSNNSPVVYEKSKIGINDVADRDTVERMIAQSNSKMEGFKKLIDSVLSKQSKKIYQSMPNSNLKSFFSNLEVDDATRAQAQKDIADDGYWGVNQTADRILSFAKAIAGDDPAKIEEMQKAVEKGFKQAKGMWGGEMPEITGKTYDKVMSGFDEWKKGSSSSNTDNSTVQTF